MDIVINLTIILNTIKIDNIWNIFDIDENINNKENINKLRNIYNDILYIHDLLENLRLIFKKYPDQNFDFIEILIRKVENIEQTFKSIKQDFKDNENDDIDIFMSYMDFVINDGYTDFNEYKQNK